MKLKKKDINIIGEGAQVKDIIVKSSHNLDEFIIAFAEKNRDITNEKTIRSYLNSIIIPSKSFKIRLMYSLDIDFDEIVISVDKQLSKHIDNVFDNIDLYSNADDQELIDYLLRISIRYKLDDLLGKLYRIKGKYLYKMVKLKESIDYMYLAIEYEPDQEKRMQYYSELGLIYYVEKEKGKAHECYEKAEKILQYFKVKNKKIVALHYFRKGILLSSENRCPEAREMLNKAIEVSDIRSEDGLYTMNIGLTYKRENNFAKAIEYYSKALEIFEEINYIRGFAITYNNIAELYRTKGEFGIGLGYAERAMSYWEHVSGWDKTMVLNTYFQLQLAIGQCNNIDKLVELLHEIDEKCQYKKYIMEVFETVIQYGKIKDVEILLEAKEIINSILRKPIFDSFSEELKRLYGDISIFLEENRGGLNQ